jgi:AraC-like DNA-binding protein
MQAARRLISGGEGFADAAAACGFADQSHMTRAFLKRMGITPGAFRKNCEDGGFTLAAFSERIDW